MDTILLIMFGALISMTTALNFMEVRRIRKKMDGNAVSVPQRSSAA